ncbi:MAG: NTP transferase domain-containing protein [Alphaproteobacteria bacterium]|nr:NTP transferase domain-containing protein [Alphaproteobacteria bacterium]
MAKALDSIDVAILAGGLGTRLAGAVPGLPKALAPVGGRPFLEHLLDWLEGHGARRVALLLGYRADQMEAHIAAHPRAGVEFSFSVEPVPLGTGGALAFARAIFASDPVLVVNGDTFVDGDISALAAAHRAARPAATMLCVEVPDAGRYGRVEIDGGRVAAFCEKDPTWHGAAAINAGVYLVSRGLLAKIPADRPVSLERDVFEKLPKGELAAFLDRKARFVDIGTPESWTGAARVIEGPGA